MKYSNPTLLKYQALQLLKYLIAIPILVSFISLPYLLSPARSQTRERTVTADKSSAQRAGLRGDLSLPARASTERTGVEVVKVDVDLITVDALVLQKDTVRVVGNLKREDFLLREDGTKQEITHFSQDSLPLSVLLLIDRGGCLDPYSTEVRNAALGALARLKPTDEVAVMTYHDNTKLLQPFTRDRAAVADVLKSVEPHHEMAAHCLNKAFYDAADFMVKSGNPAGRRVIIAITGLTRDFDCEGPSGKAAKQALYESGSVVCAVVPRTPEQRAENGAMRWMTRIGKLVRVPSLNIEDLAKETGGEILEDKPENLDGTFNTLIAHLRTRYNLAFVSTNRKRDGSTRKLKIELAPAAKKSQGNVVVKARKTYVAPRS